MDSCHRFRNVDGARFVRGVTCTPDARLRSVSFSAAAFRRRFCSCALSARLPLPLQAQCSHIKVCTFSTHIFYAHFFKFIHGLLGWCGCSILLMQWPSCLVFLLFSISSFSSPLCASAPRPLTRAPRTLTRAPRSQTADERSQALHGWRSAGWLSAAWRSNTFLFHVL